MKRSHVSILVAAGLLVCVAACLRMRTFVDPKPPPGPNTRSLFAMVRTAVRMRARKLGTDLPFPKHLLVFEYFRGYFLVCFVCLVVANILVAAMLCQAHTLGELMEMDIGN